MPEATKRIPCRLCSATVLVPKASLDTYGFCTRCGDKLHARNVYIEEHLKWQREQIVLRLKQIEELEEKLNATLMNNEELQISGTAWADKWQREYDHSTELGREIDKLLLKNAELEQFSSNQRHDLEEEIQCMIEDAAGEDI